MPAPGSRGELRLGSEWESRSGVFQEEGMEVAASSGRPPQSASLRKLGAFCPSTIDGPDKQGSSWGTQAGPTFPLVLCPHACFSPAALFLPCGEAGSFPCVVNTQDDGSSVCAL